MALAALAMAFASCSKKSGGDEEEGGDTANAITEVTATRVARANIASTLTVTGTIAALPNQDVKVSSLVPGRIARMMAAEGERVRESQVLAKIEDRPFLDQIQQAEGAVEQAKANVDNARLNRDRNQSLFQRGIAARKDLEDARTQVSVNEAALRQAEAALALAKLQLSRTEVRSPLAGTVVKRLVSDGEQVDGSAATPIFEVANLSQVELFGNVPAIYLGQIRVGETFPVTADGFPGKSFTGRVAAISPAVDPTTNVGTVRIRLANPAGLLRLGMFLSAQLPLEVHSNALVVPSQAVYRDESGEPQVYVIKGDTADASAVKLGIEAQGQTELLSGAEAGQDVILAGGYGLGDHARIKVKP